MRASFPILYENLSVLNIEERTILDVNTDTLSLLENGLINENPSRAAQARMIVGESGSGKTFLLARLFQSVKTGMSEQLVPVAIEGKRVFSSDDIWSECARMLDSQVIPDYDGILNWQANSNKRIILLLDDIGYYFRRSEKADQYALRGKLNKAGAPIIVASCDKVLPAFTDYDAPFFDGFRLHYLKPVQISSFLNTSGFDCDSSRLERLMEYLPSTIRSLIVAREIMSKSEDRSKDLICLADHFHLYFKEKFDSLNVQAQRLLICLASADTGLTLAGIRSAVHQDNGRISPYLKLMADSKLIRKDGRTPRGSLYTVSDSLFKLWLRIEIVGKA